MKTQQKDKESAPPEAIAAQSVAANPVAANPVKTSGARDESAVCGHTSNTRTEIQRLTDEATRGCKSAFGELTEHFYPRLVSFLFKRLGHIQDAEDVAAETLTRAWNQLAKFDSRYQFSTWLYTIARRQAIDFHRRESRGPARDHSPEVTEQLAAPAPRRIDDGNIWAQANAFLSDEQYSVLWLKYGEELSIAEISKALDKSQVSVRVTLHRARKLLAKRLNREEWRTT